MITQPKDPMVINFGEKSYVVVAAAVAVAAAVVYFFRQNWDLGR
jgi:hypothetical protein